MDPARVAVATGADRFGLACALAERANWVEHRLNAAAALGVEQYEETITQSVLLDLRQRIPDLNIEVYTRVQENRDSGADWMWFWEGEDLWFHHLVQAKRLVSIGRGQVGYKLGYRPRKSSDAASTSRLQVETLLAASQRLGVPAIYALYNSSTDEPRAAKCGFWPAVALGDEGVTVLSAEIAEALVRRSSRGLRDAVPLGAVAPFARPWSCLALCGERQCMRLPFGGEPGWSRLGLDRPGRPGDLAYGAALALLAAQQLVEETQLLSEERVVGAPVQAGLLPEPPPWFRQILELRRGVVDGEDLLDFAEAPNELRGVVVLRPNPSD